MPLPMPLPMTQPMTDPALLAGTRVLISGASRGIGRAIAQTLAAAGADVSICARHADSLETTAGALRGLGHRVHAQRCDLADGAQIQDWVAASAAALGGIDIVINNASGLGHDNDDASWQADIDVDLLSAVRCNRAALPHLQRSAQPSILNISSINALRPTPRAISYSTVKAALNYYTTTLAAQLARQRIRVNAIAPGSIEFEGGLWAERRDTDPTLYARTRESIPFGGFGSTVDVAQAALFLCSPQARWITGQVLAVDGGQMLGV